MAEQTVSHDELDHTHDEEEPCKELLILYATETGNAQDCADYIARQCRRIGFHGRVLSVDAYSPTDLIEEPLVLFVVSTTGSGVEPRAMTALWNILLRSDLPSDLFEGLPFAVFGLGDTSYEKFCWAAKMLSRRMKSLGATEICDRGEADEQHPLGIEGTLEPWTTQFLKVLSQLAQQPEGYEVTSSGTPPPRVVLPAASSTELANTEDPMDNDSRYHQAKVSINERMTAQDWYQDVRHFEFDFEDAVKYEPGDVAVIHPIAEADDVQSFLDLMKWSDRADTPLAIHQSLPDFLPEVSTLRSIFTHHLDFNAVPRRNFFQYLRHFTEDERETEKLDDFLSPEGADELYEYTWKVKRTIKEVLTEFLQVRIPIDYIFDVFPPLRPRHFSIASSVKEHPHQVQLCVAIVKYRTKLKVPRRGVCTTYLSQLRPGDSLRIGFLKGLIHLPPDDNTPVICIGPGTGVAPMRSLIEERVYRGSQANTLYFGCRSESKDQHYVEQWRTLSDNGRLVYRTAFSRDGPEGVKRTYVQDRILEDGERIWRLVDDEKAWIYISGSSNKMPLAVKEAIAKAGQRYGGLDEEKSKDYVKDLVKQGRLLEECWS